MDMRGLFGAKKVEAQPEAASVAAVKRYWEIKEQMARLENELDTALQDSIEAANREGLWKGSTATFADGSKIYVERRSFVSGMRGQDLLDVVKEHFQDEYVKESLNEAAFVRDAKKNPGEFGQFFEEYTIGIEEKEYYKIKKQ